MNGPLKKKSLPTLAIALPLAMWMCMFVLARCLPPAGAHVAQAFRLVRPIDGSDMTTDAMLLPLGISQPTRQIRILLSSIPETDGILYVGCSGDFAWDLNRYLFSYLSWPRKFGTLDCCESREDERLFYPYGDQTAIRWMIYCSRPAMPEELKLSARSLGAHFWLVPVKERKEWNWYYSP
jgi:hypothetical protein